MKNNKKWLFKLFTLTVFTICFLTCEKEEEQPVLEFDKETFYEQWAAWEALGIKDYSVKVKYEEYLRGRFIFLLTIVKDGVVIETDILDSSSDDPFDDDRPTISAIFDGIEYYYRMDKNKRGSIKVTYNKDFHYPETSYFDLPYKNPPTMWGKGAYYVSEFTPLTLGTENNK